MVAKLQGLAPPLRLAGAADCHHIQMTVLPADIARKHSQSSQAQHTRPTQQLIALVGLPSKAQSRQSS